MITIRFPQRLSLITTILLLLTLIAPATAAKGKEKQRKQSKQEEQTASIILGILPFTNNASQEFKWLSTGISDSLIAKYSGAKRIKLVEREKLLEMSLSSYPEEALATKMGADYLLAGSYSLNGTRIRISARIISSATAEIFRDSSHTVTGELKDIFDLQTRLAKDIADTCSRTIPQRRLSYTVGQTLDAHKVFNQGKSTFLQAVKQQEEPNINLIQESLSLFAKAQTLNKGRFFSEAHTWEGRAYQALAEAAYHPEEREKIRTEQITKFRSDAAQAAPAFYDLGVALQSGQNYVKATQAYDDYLSWISGDSKPIISQHGTNLLARLKLTSYSKSLKSFYDLRFGIVDNSQVIYLQRAGNRRNEFVSHNPVSNTTNWKTKLIGGGRLRHNPSPQGNVTIAATDDSYFLFVDDVIFMVDKESGEINAKSTQIGRPTRKTTYAERMIYLDPKAETGILVGNYMVKSPRKKVQRFAYHFSYKTKRVKVKRLYEGKWRGGLGTSKKQFFRSKEKNGIVYFYDRALEEGKQTMAFSLQTGKKITSEEKVDHWDSTGRRKMRFDENGVYFRVSDRKLQKSNANTDERLWQYKILNRPRIIGIIDDNPLLYNYRTKTFTLYNSKAESKHVSNHAKTLINKAVCLIKQEKYYDALPELKKALAVDHTCREAYYWMGIAYSNLNNNGQNTLNALISFDRYSNEQIEDKKRSQEVYNYLRESGGITKKTTFKQQGRLTFSPQPNETKISPYLEDYFLYYGFSIFSSETNELFNLPKNVHYFDDLYSYSISGGTIRVTDYINEGTMAEIYCDDQVLAWNVSERNISAIIDSADKRQLQLFEAESGELLWSLALPQPFTKAHALKLIHKKGLILAATDNTLTKDNYFAMIDTKTKKILWQEKVSPNLIDPQGTNSIQRNDLSNLLFDGETVFYCGAYSGEVLIIDARSGNVERETTRATVVGFREYIPGHVITFRHINLQCTCHGNIEKNHNTFPHHIQTHHLRDELRHKKENYQNYYTRKCDALSRGSKHRISDIRYWVSTGDNEVTIYAIGHPRINVVDTQDGGFKERYYVPFHDPMCMFRDKDHLYVSTGRAYHSAGKRITNIYQFESTALPENWKTWDRFINPADL